MENNSFHVVIYSGKYFFLVMNGTATEECKQLWKVATFRISHTSLIEISIFLIKINET